MGLISEAIEAAGVTGDERDAGIPAGPDGYRSRNRPSSAACSRGPA